VSPELQRALRHLLETPRVLVCCDYDGTLAPIVPDPKLAFPFPGIPQALQHLAQSPGIEPALVSGRALGELRRLSQVAADIVCVGSHGAEFVPGEFAGFDQAKEQTLAEIVEVAGEIVAGVPGAAIETKPVSVAVHVRRASEPDGAEVMDAVAKQILDRPDIFVTRGKAVVEVAVVHADKGEAIERLKREWATPAAVFIGDDVTDERGFSRLTTADVGIKVGDGPTSAQFRVADPAEVLDVLTQIVLIRAV
jgi:trehalose 6-phosphate phosphatase